MIKFKFTDKLNYEALTCLKFETKKCFLENKSRFLVLWIVDNTEIATL